MNDRRKTIKGAFACALLGAAPSLPAQTRREPAFHDTDALKDALAASSGSGLVSFKSSASGSLTRSVADELNDSDVNPKRFGAKGDDRADDSIAIQTAIDTLEARGGGVVRFPPGRYRCNVVLKNGVSLVSGSTMFGYLPGHVSGVTLAQANAGFVVDTPSTLVRGAGVSGINFEGLGAHYAGGGVRLQLVKWAAVRRCTANNFADQGFQHVAGFGVVFEDILTTNVLLNRNRKQISGCVEALGTDDFLNRIEANPSLIAGHGLSTPDLLICGIVVGGANNFLSNCIGEDAERGIYVAPLRGAQHRISLCRADSNIGHGFYVDGSAVWSTCFAYYNSSAKGGAYSGFYLSSSSRANLLTACRSEGTNDRQQKYGFEDLASHTDPDSRNQYFACGGANNQERLFLIQDHFGSSVTGTTPTVRTAGGTGDVDVSGSSLVVLEDYAGYSHIKNFTGASDGQTIRIIGNTNVTIAHGFGVITRTGADMTLEPNTVYAFTRYAGKWYLN